MHFLFEYSRPPSGVAMIPYSSYDKHGKNLKMSVIAIAESELFRTFILNYIVTRFPQYNAVTVKLIRTFRLYQINAEYSNVFQKDGQIWRRRDSLIITLFNSTKKCKTYNKKI